MDGRRALYHYLRWHTTVLSIADFAFVGQDQKIQYFDSDRESMFDAVDNYMRGTLLGELTSDRQGKLWAEVGAWAYLNPTGSFPPIMQLTRADWKNNINIRENLYPNLSYLEMGGVAYSGVITGTFDAFISASPGQTPNVRGTVDRRQGLALASQSHLNKITGHRYANLNARFPEISFEANGNYSNFDIAPQETLGTEIAAEDTNIGVNVYAQYLIDSISWTYDPIKKILVCNPTLKIVTNGIDGETITIPDVPEGGGYSDFGGGFNFGRFNGFPPLLGTLSGGFYCAGWRGTYVSDLIFNISFPLDETIFTYGFSSRGIAPVPGIYLVILNIFTGDEGALFRMANSNEVIVLAPNVNVSYATLHDTTLYGNSLAPVSIGGGTISTGDFDLYAVLIKQI
jgi:hypothetical protein